MQLTKSKLQQIIREEVEKITTEGVGDWLKKQAKEYFPPTSGLGYKGHIPSQESHEEQETEQEKGYQDFLKASGFAPRKMKGRVGKKPLMYFSKNQPSKEEYLKNKEDWDELARSGLPPQQIKAAIGKGTEKVKRGTGTDTATPKPSDPVKKASNGAGAEMLRRYKAGQKG